MATALEDIRVEHEESLRGIEGKIKESYEKKISDLDAKFRRQKELTEQKRNEASQAKALQAQANTQLARAEKDVSFGFGILVKSIFWTICNTIYLADQYAGRTEKGRGKGCIPARHG